MYYIKSAKEMSTISTNKEYGIDVLSQRVLEQVMDKITFRAGCGLRCVEIKLYITDNLTLLESVVDSDNRLIINKEILCNVMKVLNANEYDIMYVRTNKLSDSLEIKW